MWHWLFGAHQVAWNDWLFGLVTGLGVVDLLRECRAWWRRRKLPRSGRMD